MGKPLFLDRKSNMKGPESIFKFNRRKTFRKSPRSGEQIDYGILILHCSLNATMPRTMQQVMEPKGECDSG